MAAYKLLKELKEQLVKVENGQPGNWLGHWAKSIRTKALKSRIADIESDLNNKKQLKK